LNPEAYSRNPGGDMLRLLCLMALAARVHADMTVVPGIDLTRYSGMWHEIARLPNRFQRKCVSDVTATYTVRADGKIRVLNECRKEDGSFTKAEGVARPASKSGPNSKLKVTFFWPFSGNYWVLDLDPEYRWALVGEPGRKYLWVLSRTPEMAEAEYERILETARRQGYDLAQLQRTPHRGR
jgi:apolipoprotein D and lipocalin family protein